MSIDCPVDVRRIWDNECCYQDYSHNGAFVIQYPSHSRQTIIATISYHDTVTRLPLSVCIGGKGTISSVDSHSPTWITSDLSGVLGFRHVRRTRQLREVHT